MSASVSFSSLSVSRFLQGADRACGSSRFKSIPMIELQRNTDMDSLALKYKKKSTRDILKTAFTSMDAEGGSEDNKRSPKVYSFNKKMLFRRAMAFCHLRDSDRFLAFMTMSFPKGTSEESCYRIWNILLTRMRREKYLQGYIWVCERQKNGTPHFHMLTNTFFPVRVVNRMAAAAIQTSVDRGECTWGQSSYSRYNGVDIRRVRSGRGGISQKRDLRAREFVVSYLAKYISKSEQTGTRRVWFCSREVSALFVSAVISDEEAGCIVDESIHDPHSTPVAIQGDGYLYQGISIPNRVIWYYITRVNELIYNYLTKQKRR